MSALSQSKEAIPSSIGDYRIDCLLQKGGTSLVYLGSNPDVNEPIAVKALSRQFLRDQQAIERFLAEAAIIQEMNHPNIIKVFNYGKWVGGCYIAMEFVQGISLRQTILQQATPLRRSLEVSLQIAHAITHLHAKGIVHRDLKPENVMLTSSGGVKLIDFGTAKFYTEKQGQEKMLGTPAYMSPEQRANPSQASFGADVFALGVIIYELILGRLSHGKIQISLLPEGIQKIVAKMLQPKIEDRYEDIVDVVAAITRYLNSHALEKDMRGTDVVGELSEDLKESSHLLIPKTLPLWPSMRLGFTSNSNMALSAVYYDFFERSTGVYTVIMAESLATGAKGLVEVSMLRGMVHALGHGGLRPTDLVEKLNNLLVELGSEEAFSMALLTLYPKEQRYSFISCGYNALWQVPRGGHAPRRITSNNVALGIQPDLAFMEVDANWALGDNLVMHTFQAGSAQNVTDVESDERLFLEALKQNLHLTPQKQVDSIFRTITTQQKKSLLEKLITIVSIERVV